MIRAIKEGRLAVTQKATCARNASRKGGAAAHRTMTVTAHGNGAHADRHDAPAVLADDDAGEHRE